MKREIVFLLEVIRCLLNDSTIEYSVSNEELDWKWLFAFAKRHSILNMLCYAIERMPEASKPDEEKCMFLYQQMMQVVAISVSQVEAAKEIEEAFKKEEIPLLAVKGICTKNRYPQPEMRTMGDIDLLYQGSHKKKVKKVLTQLGYGDSEEGRKHDSFFKAPYIGVEMHRELLASDSEYHSYYKNVWERLRLKENHNYIYEMPLEDEYIYNILHLVEHFKNGGVGIRFVMDIYVYNQMKNMKWDYVEKELSDLGLLEFYRNISLLASKWFGEKKEQIINSTLIQELEKYIISNGIYGTSRNAAATVAQKGRIKFLVQTIFPNLDNMKSMFPWLGKWPILLPYSWILRGMKSVLFRRKNIRIQFKQYQQGDKEYGEQLKAFYGRCGL